MSVGSIAVFAILLVLGKTIYIYAYIGVFFAITFGYTIYRTSRMIPLMKQNAVSYTHLTLPTKRIV